MTFRTLLSLGVVIAVLAVAPTSLTARAQNAQQVVSAFYPVRDLMPDRDEDRRDCFQIYDLTPEGDPNTIVAGYTDLFNAALRVRRRTPGGSFTVIYDSPSTPDLYGTVCEIELVDFDGDGILDVLLSLGSRGSVAWAYRWNAGQLQNITPTISDGRGDDTLLYNAAVVDVKHDGTVQLLSSGQSLPAEGERLNTFSTLYQFESVGYREDRPVLAVLAFGVSGPPSSRFEWFRLVTGHNGPYVLRVINGEPQGQHRATSATIKVNDVVIVNPSQLTDQAEFLDVTFPTLLVDNNKVEVQLDGPPGATILLLIEDLSARRPAGPFRF